MIGDHKKTDIITAALNKASTSGGRDLGTSKGKGGTTVFALL